AVLSVNTKSWKPASRTRTAATYSSLRMPGTSGFTAAGRMVTIAVFRLTPSPPQGGMGGCCLFFQEGVHLRDGDRALADRGPDPLDRPPAHVAGRKHAGPARLVERRRAEER